MTDTAIASLYAEHVAQRRRQVEQALSETGFEALLLHAGTPLRYFADDQDAPFHSNPHFASWVPLRGPHHMLLVRGGHKPKLVRVAPEDYWYEPAPLGDPFWAREFDLVEVGSEEEAWAAVHSKKATAYIGDAPERARKRGFTGSEVNPWPLVARLDWERSYKTPYEVACVEEAGRVAARGHAAAKRAFEQGASELEIHRAFVDAVGGVEHELPYETIVALDAKGATLHYTGKRTQRDGKVLLIDAGAAHLGYASDITRTWLRDGVPQGFRDLVAGVERLQQELCELVRPRTAYPDLHHEAHIKIADLLNDLGLIDLRGEDAVSRGLTQPFFPHGLGHFLGIQVHDVAGHQKERSGGTQPPPAHSPHLRTTRRVEEGQVFTIEPGVYFIEMLLRPHRAGETAKHFAWDAIDALAPFGGVRVEDDVAVTATGHRNLTRPHVDAAL